MRKSRDHVMFLTRFIEYIASRFHLFYKIASLYYRSIIQREIALADIDSSDHVLFVGGGPCPFSAVLLHQQTGARVTVIDYDTSCISCSRLLVQKLGCDDHIKVLQKNGCDLCKEITREYSVVHIAAQVNPLEQVLARIQQYSMNGTRILIRLPRNKKDRLHNVLRDMKSARCLRTLHSSVKNLDSTALYVKN